MLPNKQKTPDAAKAVIGQFPASVMTLALLAGFFVHCNTASLKSFLVVQYNKQYNNNTFTGKATIWFCNLRFYDLRSAE